MNRVSTFRFSQTYLYKLHVLANTLDKAFDQVLRAHANVTLSQFMLLATVAEHGTINQRKIAGLVGTSPPAIKRQVDLALHAQWLEVSAADNTLGQSLRLTAKGETVIQHALQALDQHLLKIFVDGDEQTDLMTHINTLLGHTKGVGARAGTAEARQDNDKQKGSQ